MVRSWLTKVLELAEIDAPGGSTRAASATCASARAVPISTIMTAADWSSLKTMVRHYIRPLPQGASATEHLSVGVGRLMISVISIFVAIIMIVRFY